MKRRVIVKALVAACGLTASMLATAQDGPTIRILCGFPPGGLTDLVARLFADKLRVELNQPVIVENKAGAGGRLAAQALKAAQADGSTYMIAPNSVPILQELLYPRKVLGYDMLADWVPVSTLTTYPFGMVVQRSLGVKNAREYVSWVKSNPKMAVYGTGGAGGQAHFSGTQLAMAAGIQIDSIPYKGNGPVNVDLMGGQLPAAILPAADLMQHRNNPKLQILGIFESERSPLIPDVPTFSEQGLNFDVGRAWMGMWAPAKAPRTEVARVEAAVRKILSDAAFKEQLMSRFTMYPMFRTSAEMDSLQRSELEVWRPVIKASGFTPDA
jgi:tripartite-type tricarboxylate transporter receptor subunit TctC